MKSKITLFSVFIFFIILCNNNFSHAQNIIGWRIMIGANAPAFLAFPTEVDNARWDNNEMNDFFKFSTRNENTMQISYNGKGEPPTSGTGFSVIQGKNTHIFTLIFKKEYDINKDPVLFYDFSDKAKLKAAAEQAKKSAAPAQANTDKDEPVVAANTKAQEQEEKAEAQRRAKEEETRKKELAVAQQQRKKEIEVQQKAEAEKAKQAEKARETEIAKAKAEAIARDNEQKKAKAEEAAIAKANAEAERKKNEEATRLKREKEAEDKRLALASAQQKEKEKQEKDRDKAAKDKAARELAEQKQQEAQAEKLRLAQEKLERDEAERKRRAALAQQQAEAKRIAKEEAQAKLAALEKERELAKRNAQYNIVGLWNRYGKKGINLYEIPHEQHNYNNTDFYVAKDTFQNYQNSQVFLAEEPRLNISTPTKKDVTLTLESISFKGPIAYYKVQVKNNGKDDYLVGVNKLAWYNPDGSAKLFLKASYITDIGFFPMVKPGETKSYVYATRAANINNDDHMVLYVNERRMEQPAFEISFDGSVYQKELARVEKPLGAKGKNGDKEFSKKEQKKSRKERKKEREGNGN